MNLKDQVVNLELAKKLKELGVKQESLFYWYEGLQHPFVDYHEQGCIHQDYPNPNILCSAFTLSELLELLPDINTSQPQLVRGYLVGETALKYCIRYGWEDDENHLFVDINPCNSAAKMLIYLIENGLIKND